MDLEQTDKERLRVYLKLAASLHRAMAETSLRSKDKENIWNHVGYRQYARKYEELLNYIKVEVELPQLFDSYRVEDMPGPGHTLPFQRQEIFESVYANLSLLVSYIETGLDIVEDEILSLRDFVKSRLRSAVFEPPKKEKEIQDIIEQLLIGHGMQKGQDYDREVGRVKVSVKEVVPDFIVFKLSLAMEVKLIKTAERAKKIVDEVNADIASYKKEYRHLLFVIYDLGQIRDEVEFRQDFESETNVSVSGNQALIGCWLARLFYPDDSWTFSRRKSAFPRYGTRVLSRTVKWAPRGVYGAQTERPYPTNGASKG